LTLAHGLTDGSDTSDNTFSAENSIKAIVIYPAAKPLAQKVDK
jgi:hypothetical protein